LRLIPFTFALIAPIAFAGWLFFRRKSGIEIVHLYGLSYFTATLFFFAASEYRLPIVIVLLPFAGKLLTQLVSYLKNTEWAAILRTVLYVVVFAIPINMPTGFTKNLQSSRMDYYNLGSVLEKQMRFEEASEMLQRSLLIDPSFIEAHRALGDSYHALGMRQEAAREFSLAGVDPKPELLLLDAEEQIFEAHSKAMMGDLTGALKAYGEAVAAHPDPPAYAYYNMAYLALQLGDTLRAMDEINIAAEIEPDEPQIEYLIGWINECRNMWKEANDHYLFALQKRPNFHKARIQSARMYIRMGNAEKAAVMIEPLIGVQLDNEEMYNEVLEIAREVGY